MNRMNRRIAGVGSLLAALLAWESSRAPPPRCRGGAGNRPAKVQNARSSVSNVT